MDYITIPIPAGIAPDRKASLTRRALKVRAARMLKPASRTTMPRIRIAAASRERNTEMPSVRTVNPARLT